MNCHRVGCAVIGVLEVSQIACWGRELGWDVWVLVGMGMVHHGLIMTALHLAVKGMPIWKPRPRKRSTSLQMLALVLKKDILYSLSKHFMA